MLKELAARARREITLPKIQAEHCVHVRIEHAHCRACVDACPRQAWILDDQILGIDPQACDGCGLCVSACPQGALEHDLHLLPRQWRDRLLAFCGCEYSDIGAGEGQLPCLHSLSLRDLLRLYNRGCHSLMVTTGDCDACERGRVTRLSERVQQLNHMLTSRALPVFQIRKLPENRWKAMQLTTHNAEVESHLDRRKFLRDTIQKGLEQGLKRSQTTASDRSGFSPPGAMLPHVSAQDVFPHVPNIDPQNCQGCDACVHLCPQQAIVMVAEGTQVGYHLHAEKCSDCGICIDVCEYQAVKVFEMQVKSQTAVILRHYTCCACGVHYHLPEEQVNERQLCQICRKVNHHRNLFQVRS